MFMNNYKKRTFVRILVLLLAALSFLPQSSDAQRQTSNRTAATRAASGKPRLVLAIIVDQFRYDYIERFWDLFGNEGFKLLINEGALFTNANYEYVPTYTACGHASIFSGSVPALNGIVGNLWFDRESGKQRIMVGDDNAHLVTGKGVLPRGGGARPKT